MSEPYVLPSQCEQVFYSEVSGRQGWSFVIGHDPRGRSVKYNIVEEAEDGVEEEGDHVEDQHELDVDDHNVTQEDVEELVEADDVSNNVHDEDDIDDYHFIETNNDDDDDIAFNPYNVESGSDDTDADLDTDEDDHEVH